MQSVGTLNMESDIEKEPQQEDGEEELSQNKEVIDVQPMPASGVWKSCETT